MIRYILAHGGNVNRIFDDFSNHFYSATEEGQGAAVKLMLEDLDPVFLASNDEDERVLLLYFAVAGDFQVHVEKFVQSSWLQHRGIMVKDAHTSYPRFYSPLDFAVRIADERIATVLLNELARCETQDLRTYLHGPLCLAICEGKEYMINLLLDHGADPDYPGPGGGRLPLMLAIKNESIFRLLLERGADPRARFDYTPSDASVLQEVIKTGRVTLVQELLDRAVPINRNTLIWGVLRGGEQMVELFLANGMLELPPRMKGRSKRELILLDAAHREQLRLLKYLVVRQFGISARRSPDLLFSLASVACEPGFWSRSMLRSVVFEPYFTRGFPCFPSFV